MKRRTKKIGLAILAIYLTTQLVGAAVGAFIAVYYGPEAEAIVLEMLK